MTANKTDIINRLKLDILPLEGLRVTGMNQGLDLGLGVINNAFPQRQFPLGAVHEFISAGAESAAASAAFVAGIAGGLMKQGAAALWIGSRRNIFPPALKSFGIDPERIVFIDLQKERDVLWAMEEALKCGGVAAVIGEMSELSFTASRRFQLAVEQSRVTGFILRSNPRFLNTNACVSRWNIQPLSSEAEDDLPGLGFPRWKVELLKIRNGKPGKWNMEWNAGQFRLIEEFLSDDILKKGNEDQIPRPFAHEFPKRKTG